MRVSLCSGISVVALIAFTAAWAAEPASVPATAPLPLAITPADAPMQAYDAGELRVLVPGSRTGGDFSVVELKEMPGYRTPPHMHPSMDESFYVLEGTLEINLAGTVHRVPPGSFVHVPRGTPHAQGAADGQPVRMLAWLSPGGFEAFFTDRVELARTVQRGDAGFQPRMLEIVDRYGDWLQPAELPAGPQP